MLITFCCCNFVTLYSDVAIVSIATVLQILQIYCEECLSGSQTMHQMHFWLGFCPRPSWGADDAPPDPIVNPTLRRLWCLTLGTFGTFGAFFSPLLTKVLIFCFHVLAAMALQSVIQQQELGQSVLCHRNLEFKGQDLRKLRHKM